jgi:precorrin-3B synthase
MATGDGLLARITTSSPISLEAFAALCEAGQTHGNGVVEVTHRGSLQVRGLSPASAPLFARFVHALGLADEGNPAILTPPLLGQESEDCPDLGGLASALRKELKARAELVSLGPKVSVLIDRGGALHLDEMPADLRFRAGQGLGFHMSIAGSASDSISLGWVASKRVTEAAIRVLIAIADRGEHARARDFANGAGTRALRLLLADILSPASPPPPRPRAEPIGVHRLNNGLKAVGFALPFGYADFQVLRRLMHRAARCGASSIRPVAGRALLILGIRADAVEEIVAAAATEKLIVQRDDARRYVVACAGAPACSSALLATRQFAAQVAEAAGPYLDDSITIHLSGCGKGCAHPEAAGLTLAGPDRLVINGRASDAPHARISPVDFVAGLKTMRPERKGSLATRILDEDFISRIGAVRPMGPAHGEIA